MKLGIHTKTAKELREDLELYAEYCENHTLNAQAYGSSVATELFVSMLNPKYRGPNFKWSKFVNMAVDDAEVSVYRGFSDEVWNKFSPLIVESAKHSAKLRAKDLLRRSGVEEWMKL